MFYRLRDFPKARTRQYPSPPDLRIRRLILKLHGERFQTASKRFGALDESGVRFSRRDRVGSFLDQLVGEE